jgi:hypothetical protein
MLRRAPSSSRYVAIIAAIIDAINTLVASMALPPRTKGPS